jgi:hypothetical protein
MIKKVLITSALVASVSASAFADSSNYAPQVTLGGSLDTQVGYVKQRNDFRYSDPQSESSSKLTDHAIVNDTKLWLDIQGRADSGFEYGGLIKLYADTSNAKEEALSGDTNSQAEQTMAYVEGMFGRVEFGNYVGVGDTMKVDAATFASATGGIDGDAKYWWNNNSMANWINNGNQDMVRYIFLTSPNLPTDDLGTVGIKGKNAGKISYYTPNFSGFMAGVTYTPDIQVYGTIYEAKTVTKTIPYSASAGSPYTMELPVYKNIFTGGLYYEDMFEQFGVKASVTGEVGSPKKYNNNGDITIINRKLRAWQAGINLSYMGYTIGGSYGNWGKSMLTVDSSAKSTKYYTLGAGYEYGPFSTSLTYFNSARGLQPESGKRNKLQLVSFGLDYKLAPGLMPYAEVTWFQNKDRDLNTAVTPNTYYDSNKGTVFLLGSKLQF